MPAHRPAAMFANCRMLIGVESANTDHVNSICTPNARLTGRCVATYGRHTFWEHCTVNDVAVCHTRVRYAIPFESAHIGEHVDAMTPQVVKFGRLPTTGSGCRSRAMVVLLLLLVQLLASRDARASDTNGVHLSLKQLITGAQGLTVLSVCRSQRIQNFRNCVCST